MVEHPIIKSIVKAIVTEQIIIEGSVSQIFNLEDWRETIFENCFTDSSRCGKCLSSGNKSCSLPRNKAMRYARELKKYYDK